MTQERKPIEKLDLDNAGVIRQLATTEYAPLAMFVLLEIQSKINELVERVNKLSDNQK